MNHSSAKSAALQKLMDLMDEHETEGLKGLKKPAVTEVSMTAVKPKTDFEKTFAGLHGDEGSPDEEASESPDEEASEEDEPSEEEKAQIAALYHKFCK